MHPALAAPLPVAAVDVLFTGRSRPAGTAPLEHRWAAAVLLEDEMERLLP